MSAPPRTSLEAIIRAGAELVERSGAAGLTMQAVAEQVGVRAPSLYKHVAGRDALVRLVAEDAARDLGVRVDAAAPPGTPSRLAVAAVAHALRRFAAERPAGFRLVFEPASAAVRADPEVSAQAARTVLRVAAELAGPEHALEAARTLTAWASGFTSMELAGAFGLGGDVERAFDFGVERVADALSAAPLSPGRPR